MANFWPKLDEVRTIWRTLSSRAKERDWLVQKAFSTIKKCQWKKEKVFPQRGLSLAKKSSKNKSGPKHEGHKTFSTWGFHKSANKWKWNKLTCFSILLPFELLSVCRCVCSSSCVCVCVWRRLSGQLDTIDTNQAETHTHTHRQIGWCSSGDPG